MGAMGSFGTSVKDASLKPRRLNGQREAFCLNAHRLLSGWSPIAGRSWVVLLKRLHGTLAEQLLGAFNEASVGGYG
jgi:hypothetical protein